MSPPRDWRNRDPLAPPDPGSTPGWDTHVGEQDDAGEGIRLTPAPPTPPSVPRPAPALSVYDAGEAEFQRMSLEEIRNSDPGEVDADEQWAAFLASAPPHVRAFLAQLAAKRR